MDPYDHGRGTNIGRRLDHPPTQRVQALVHGVIGAPVSLETSGGIASLRLARPEKRNAIDGECLELLRRYIGSIDEDDSVRVVLVSGEGPMFCAGADLGYVQARLGSSSDYAAFLEDWHDAFDRVERCAKPTIAVVTGAALAGGLELTQVCDFVVAGAGAVFGDQHSRLGLFPGGGSTQRLPRLVGGRQAKWLLMSGQQVTAQEAHRLGMVNLVVPDEEAGAAAQEMAEQLARLSAHGLRLIKRAVNEGTRLEVGHGLALERELAVAHMCTEDPGIGLKAFAERQAPVFSGASGAPLDLAVAGARP